MGCGAPACRVGLYDDLHRRELAAQPTEESPTTFQVRAELLLLDDTRVDAPPVIAITALLDEPLAELSVILGLDVAAISAAPAEFVPHFMLEVAPPPPPAAPPQPDGLSWAMVFAVAVGVIFFAAAVVLGARLLRQKRYRRYRNSQLLVEHVSEQVELAHHELELRESG
eukprot:4394576-Prymnesium_polylepis.1